MPLGQLMDQKRTSIPRQPKPALSVILPDNFHRLPLFPISANADSHFRLGRCFNDGTVNGLPIS
jgi:hypothetical protein